MAATTFTNNTATPAGLWDTDSVHHIAAPYGGTATLEPTGVTQETIDIYVKSGAGVNGTATKPVNGTAPVATGDAVVGAQLASTVGLWSAYPPPLYAYQWQRSADGDAPWADIAGETTAVYTLTGDDDAAFVRCVVTGTNVAGSTDAESNVIGIIAEA